MDGKFECSGCATYCCYGVEDGHRRWGMTLPLCRSSEKIFNKVGEFRFRKQVKEVDDVA